MRANNKSLDLMFDESFPIASLSTLLLLAIDFELPELIKQIQPLRSVNKVIYNGYKRVINDANFWKDLFYARYADLFHDDNKALNNLLKSVISSHEDKLYIYRELVLICHHFTYLNIHYNDESDDILVRKLSENISTKINNVFNSICAKAKLALPTTISTDKDEANLENVVLYRLMIINIINRAVYRYLDNNFIFKVENCLQLIETPLERNNLFTLLNNIKTFTMNNHYLPAYASTPCIKFCGLAYDTFYELTSLDYIFKSLSSAQDWVFFRDFMASSYLKNCDDVLKKYSHIITAGRRLTGNNDLSIESLMPSSRKELFNFHKNQYEAGKVSSRSLITIVNPQPVGEMNESTPLVQVPVFRLTNTHEQGCASKITLVPMFLVSFALTFYVYSFVDFKNESDKTMAEIFTCLGLGIALTVSDVTSRYYTGGGIFSNALTGLKRCWALRSQHESHPRRDDYEVLDSGSDDDEAHDIESQTSANQFEDIDEENIYQPR